MTVVLAIWEAEMWDFEFQVNLGNTNKLKTHMLIYPSLHSLFGLNVK